MSRGKYIVVGNENLGIEKAIVFSPIEDHHQMAQCHIGTMTKVLGAGFVSIGQTPQGELSVTCHGESTSLKIKSRGQKDAHAVKWAIFGDESDIRY